MVRTLIADDEILARQRLRSFLAPHADFEVIAESTDGVELINGVRKHTPDLVLLDVEMPLLDGLSAWRQLGASTLPLVIFVTAHAKFAVEGFELQAVDYLLKPVARARFDAALDRVRAVLALPEAGSLPVFQREQLPAPCYLERLVLKHDGEYHFIKVDDIVWAGAESDFVKVHTTAGAHLVRQSLASLEAVLDPRQFLRIHRSHLIARDRIRKVFVVQRSDYAVVMSDGAELRVSRPYCNAIKQLLAAHGV